MRKGFTLNLEGPDGASKSTTIKGLLDVWKWGEVQALHDPGVHAGHEAGQKLRTIAKEMELTPDAETLIFMACRKELVDVFTKSQEEGVSSIIDRYKPSTAIYQGIIKGRTELIDKLENVIGFPEPDITIYLTAPFEVLTERLIKRASNIDKFKRNEDFRKMVWEAYNQYMKAHMLRSKNVFIVNAKVPSKDVLQECINIIDEYTGGEYERFS